jgi:hypothetical protein
MEAIASGLLAVSLLTQLRSENIESPLRLLRISL